MRSITYKWPLNLALSLAFTGLVGLTGSGSVSARELQLDLSVSSAMNHPAWQQSEMNGIAVRFGSDANTSYANVSAPVPLDGFARTSVQKNGRYIQREDAPVCHEALRNTLAKAAEQARKVGANAVVNITSKFLDTPLNSKNRYLCNSGTGSATVDLVVQFATLKPENLKVSTQAMLPMAQLPGALAARVYPPAMSSAAVTDADAIPFIGQGCRLFYAQEWLKFPMPRAFAIAPTGYCHSGAGFNPKNGTHKDPAIRALEGCNAKANTPCHLYAVDNNVVYNPAGISEEDLKPVAVK
jgi:uncharacterized protein YbjQ (UPF0145 family)